MNHRQLVIIFMSFISFLMLIPAFAADTQDVTLPPAKATQKITVTVTHWDAHPPSSVASSDITCPPAVGEFVAHGTVPIIYGYYPGYGDETVTYYQCKETYWNMDPYFVNTLKANKWSKCCLNPNYGGSCRSQSEMCSMTYNAGPPFMDLNISMPETGNSVNPTGGNDVVLLINNYQFRVSAKNITPNAPSNVMYAFTGAGTNIHRNITKKLLTAWGTALDYVLPDNGISPDYGSGINAAITFDFVGPNYSNAGSGSTYDKTYSSMWNQSGYWGQFVCMSGFTYIYPQFLGHTCHVSCGNYWKWYQSSVGAPGYAATFCAGHDCWVSSNSSGNTVSAVMNCNT